MAGLKNWIVFQTNFLLALFSPTRSRSLSNFSTRSPSMPSDKAGGQNHSRNRRANRGGEFRTRFPIISSFLPYLYINCKTNIVIIIYFVIQIVTNVSELPQGCLKLTDSCSELERNSAADSIKPLFEGPLNPTSASITNKIFVHPLEQISVFGKSGVELLTSSLRKCRPRC